MEWDELYKKYGSKTKTKRTKKLFIVLIVILLFSGVLVLFYFYPEIWQNLLSSTENCDAIISTVDGFISHYSQVRLNSSLENSLSKVCSYLIDNNYTTQINNVTYVHTYFNVSSCDLNKIKDGLDNPNTVSLDDLEVYISVSNLYALKKTTSYLKDIFTDDFSSGCDLIKSSSSELYFTVFIASHGMAYMFQSALSSVCTRSSVFNFTETEKKECLITLLDAEESTANYYSTLDYSGNVSACVSLAHLSAEESILINDESCQKMIDYRKELVDKIKEGDMDRHQKYLSFVGLQYQDLYLGEEVLIETLEKELIDRFTNSKYKAKFLELHEETWGTS